MAVELHELLPLFVGCCPGLRDRLVLAVDDWLGDDGTISYFQISSALAQLVVERFLAGDYDCSDGLFKVDPVV